VRNEQYFRTARAVEDVLLRMIEQEMRHYRTRAEAAIAGVSNPERKSEKIAELSATSPIISALAETAECLRGICLDLGDVMADALGGKYGHSVLKDAAIRLLERRAPGVNRDTIVPTLRKSAEYARKNYLEGREAQRATKKPPQWNPESSERFLRLVGGHIPVTVVIKEFPSGRQPRFVSVRVPPSCLSVLDPSIGGSADGPVCIPVLEKGDATEYLLESDTERIVVVANDVEMLFLACLAQVSPAYDLKFVSVRTSPFQNVARPELWTDLIRVLRQLTGDGGESQTVGAGSHVFAEVDVAGFARKEVPLVSREVGGKRHLTINAWNRGIKNLNDTLQKALQQGQSRAAKALELMTHEFYHAGLFDESAFISPGALHVLDVREATLIEVCELMTEFFDVRRGQAK
jgi:hypothetical protein